MDKKRLLTIIAFINICLFWGTNNLATKIGISSMHPLQFSGIRFLVAGIIMAVISRLMNKDNTKYEKKEYLSLFFLGTIMFSITNGCVVYANKYLDSGMVTILLSTIPIIATIIDFFINRTKIPGVATIIGLVLGFIGVIIVTLNSSSEMNISFLGILLSLLAAFFWSLGSNYSKNAVIRGPLVRQISIQSLFAAMILLGTVAATSNFSISSITSEAMMPILYLAVFDSVVGFVSYSYLLKVLPISKVSAYAYINPVVALVAGYLVLGESISTSKVIGMAVISVGVFLIQKDKVTKTRKDVIHNV